MMEGRGEEGRCEGGEVGEGRWRGGKVWGRGDVGEGRCEGEREKLGRLGV